MRRRELWDALGFEAEGKLFDDGVGENLSGDTLYLKLGLGRVACERVIEGELEIFSLAHVCDSVVLHTAERSRDGLSLSIED